MNPVELLMRRRNVLAFIEADSIEVVFTRETKTKTPAGGFITSWAPLSVCQIARIIPSKRRYAYTGVNTEAGQIPLWPYILEGLYNMDIKVDDKFTWDGQEYQVKSIEPDREEKTIAAIDFFGPRP